MKAPWLEPQGGQEASAVAKTKPLPDEVDAASNPPPVVENPPRTVPVAESGAPPETTVASAGRSGPPPERLRSVLETIALVIAPASLISALAFYFGWVFTGSRARYFGLDP